MRSLGFGSLGSGTLDHRDLHSAHNHNPPPHVSRPRSVPAMKPTAPCAVTLPAHQPHASHRRPRRKMCRHPVECHLESRHAAYATSRLSAHPAPTCGAMRESSRTTLVPRLTAPATSPLRACPPPLAYVAPLIASRVARYTPPPLPATAAGHLPRLASRVAALRASARNVRHPAAAIPRSPSPQVES